MKKWFTLSFLSLAFFFYMSDRALFGLLVIPIQESTGLSDIQIGLVGTAMFWVYAAIVPFAGVLGDIFDRRRLIAFAIVLWGAATALTGLAGGFLGFVFVRSVLLTGIQTVYTPAASALIAEEHGATRSTALSIHQAALYLGLMCSGAIVSAALSCGIGWQGIYGIFGGATFAVGIAFFAYASESKGKSHSAKPMKRAAGRSGFRDGMKAFFCNPAALCAGGGYMCVLFVTNAYASWAPKFVANRFDLGVGASGKGVMFYHNCAALAAILVAGFLTDMLVRRNPKARLWIQVASLLVGAPLLVCFGLAPTIGCVWAAIAAWGIARGFFQSNAFASLFDVVPAKSRASAVGFLNVLTALVCSFAPLSLGALSQRFGTDGLAAGFAAMGALLLLGAAIMMISCIAFFNKCKVENA